MRKSTNFNLNIVEGSDLVNPLIQDVPNYETIDEQMYKNECNSIGIATELKNGTVHALTRTIPNAPMFRFKATSNFTAGDTFTVDGIQASALTPSGETLASGCYVIGSEVLCVLRESLLTVYVSGGTVTTAQDSEKLGGQLPEYYGTAENVSLALTTAQSANQLTLSLQQTIGEIENRQSTNNVKSEILLPFNEVYVFPSDGYLCVSMASSTNGYGGAQVYDNNNTIIGSFGVLAIASIGASNDLLFVRKGMKVKFSYKSNETVSCKFIPLNY